MMLQDVVPEEPRAQLTESPTLDVNSQHQLRNNELVLHTGPRPGWEFPDGDIHPYTRPLTFADLESCVALENAAFTKIEDRCSREKFIYRLNKCGSLSLGLFCTATPDSKLPAETLSTGRPVESSRENGALSVLLAHIVATQSKTKVVTDEAMDFPRDWDSPQALTSAVGHQEDGRTICVHSLAVLPAYQCLGLGRILMTTYVQQMTAAGIADKVAIICHDHLVAYYEKMGFHSKGTSKAQFGGGGWVDMVLELKQEPRAIYG